MKKIVLSLLCAGLSIFFTTSAMSQELVQSRKAAVLAPALLVGEGTAAGTTQPKKIPSRARTTILRFESGQIELSDIQKEMLMNVVRQLNGIYSVPTVVALGASKNINDAREWITAIERFLNAYVSNRFEFSVRYIAPENIVPSVNNTVKITIKR